MRRFSVNHLRVVFLVNCLLVLSDTKPNAPFNEVKVTLAPSQQPWPSLAERCDALYANETTHHSTDNGPQESSTEDRLTADGFIKNKHTESSLEHDLTNKLKTIYARVYELADNLEATLAYTCELTSRLKKTRATLEEYTRNSNKLVERLKKTEVFVTVLLKKSHVEDNDTKEEDSKEKTRQVLTTEDYSSTVFYDDKKQNYTGCNSTTGLSSNMSCIDGTSNKLEVQTVQEEKNSTMWQNILAKIGFQFLLVSPTAPILNGTMNVSKDEMRKEVKKPAPLLRNLTLLVNDFTEPQQLPEELVKEDPYDDDLSEEEGLEANNGGGVLLRDYDSGDHHHHYTQMRNSKGNTGPPGTPGLPGTPGAAGPAGAAGAAGVSGGTGTKGEPGIGIPGTNGIPGTQGAPGQTGATGAVGATGVAGIQGVQGPQGNQGPTGVAGPQGDKGATG